MTIFPNPQGASEEPKPASKPLSKQVDNPRLVFKLRTPTKKYWTMCDAYLDSDRADIKAIAKEFGKVFGLHGDTMKVKRGAVLWQTDDSDYYGNATLTSRVETWIILRWADIYHQLEYYPSPHIADDPVSDLAEQSHADSTDVHQSAQVFPNQERGE